jgi:hypothetical protein
MLAVSNLKVGPIRELVLNNRINAFLYEDFRMPIVIVEIIFDTGSFHDPVNKQGISNIIAENIVSSRLHRQLQALGISCYANATGEYTKIIAEMHPKRVKNFFSTIYRNISRFSIENLEILKKQMIIDRKLSSYNSEDYIANVIFAHVNLKNANTTNLIFNEQSLSSISKNDVRRFFNKNYKNAHLSVIVSGAIGYKNFVKVLQSTFGNLASRRAISFNHYKNCIFKDVRIENKHLQRSARYFYVIHQNSGFLDAFFSVFDYEMFKFFKKANPIISDYYMQDIINHGDCVREICLIPKRDISLKKMQEIYEIFVKRMCKKHFSSDFLASCALTEKYSGQFLFCDLHNVCSHIKNSYLSDKNVNSIYEIENDIQNIDQNSIKTLSQKILQQNLVLKITTQYKSDK